MGASLAERCPLGERALPKMPFEPLRPPRHARHSPPATTTSLKMLSTGFTAAHHTRDDWPRGPAGIRRR